LARGGGSTLFAQWTQNVDRAVWRALFPTFAGGGDQNVEIARGSAGRSTFWSSYDQNVDVDRRSAGGSTFWHLTRLLAAPRETALLTARPFTTAEPATAERPRPAPIAR
jgi:hypothetical protein